MAAAKEYMRETAKELHKPFRRNFARVRTTFTHKDETWAMDLIQMDEWAKENDGAKYILVVVDGFTRYAWAWPLTSKEAPVVFSAFENIIERSKRKPTVLWVDEGKEFYNKYFAQWCKQNKARMVSSHGEVKSALAERMVRTIREQIWYRFTELNTRRWISFLPQIMKWYNSRKHRTLGMSPEEASLPKNAARVFAIVGPRRHPTSIADDRKEAFKIGDKVRIARIKGKFEKGFMPNWSHEIFTVDRIIQDHDVTQPLMYGLRDNRGQMIHGGFYAAELQKVSPKIADVRLVEKVLKKRTVKGHKEVLVKWLGTSQEDWIPEENVVFKP